MRTVLPAALLLFALLLGGATVTTAQGPVILMSLDAEDGGPDNRNGPSSAYGTMLNSILDHVHGNREGILVVGAGKTATDDVSAFWSRMTRWTEQDIFFVHGPDAIAAVDFTPFALVVVASNEIETPEGGLTQSENDALADRKEDLAAFVNSGGGLWGFMQGGFAEPFAYVDSVLPIEVGTGQAFRYITPTLEGVRIGLNEVFEVCCWHDEILDFPETMTVLAVRTKTGAAIAVGGLEALLGTAVAVPLDLNPGYFPNKLDIGKSDKVACAINGTADLDVLDLDPDSLTIRGVAPYKVERKDVSPPFAPYLSKTSILDGIPGKKDGEKDLVLYFDREELLATLDPVVRGVQHRLELRGRFLDGREIVGVDYVQLVGEKKEDKKDKK